MSTLPDSDASTHDNRRPWRDRLPEADRPHVARLFFSVAAQLDDPAEICRKVATMAAEFRDAAKQSGDEIAHARWSHLLHVLASDPAAATFHAAACRDWARLSDAEKAAKNRPTPKQLALIRKLGYTASIEELDRRRASAQNEELLRGRPTR